MTHWPTDDAKWGFLAVFLMMEIFMFRSTTMAMIYHDDQLEQISYCVCMCIFVPWQFSHKDSLVMVNHIRQTLLWSRARTSWSPFIRSPWRPTRVDAFRNLPFTRFTPPPNFEARNPENNDAGFKKLDNFIFWTYLERIPSEKNRENDTSQGWMPTVFVFPTASLFITTQTLNGTNGRFTSVPIFTIKINQMHVNVKKYGWFFGYINFKCM